MGARFHDDFQGLENWSTEVDAGWELADFGVETTWWQRPFCEGELYDEALRRANFRARQPLFYCVRRGSAHDGSLDNALKRQAESLGVAVCLGQKADAAAVDIFAGGPSWQPIGIARGLTFALDHRDVAAQIHSDRMAPGGYVYFLVAQGQATLAIVLSREFSSAQRCLRRAVERVEALYGVRVPPEANEWAGNAAFRIPTTCVRGRTLWVGEAAGFQDALFGFGIRTAMISGALAGLSIAEGLNYERAWRQRLHPFLEASRVNRFVYERMPAARRLFWRVASVAPDGTSVLRHIYRRTWLHRLASQLF